MSAATLAAALTVVAIAAERRQETTWRPALPAGLDAYLPVPEENPPTPEAVALGRRLFFDPMLSRDRTVACATCHDPARAFTDGRVVAQGAFGRAGRRNAPTLVNRAYGRAQFWDGRAERLEQQALEPFGDPNEFDLPIPGALDRLRTDRTYAALFTEAFGQPPGDATLARALASYVRTILAGGSAVDRYDAGAREALTPLERQGLRLFRGRANCSACHLGPTFSDDTFHNTGVAWSESGLRDAGRFAVTGVARDRGAFKTPTLREVARTAPYMHDGSLATLEEVVEFYDRGGRPNPHLDPEIRPLGLDAADRAALVAFLRALSGTILEGRVVALGSGLK